MVIIFIISMLVYFYRSRVKYYNKQKVLLENLVAEKTVELNEKNATLLNQA